MSARDRLKLLGDRADELTRWQAAAEEQAETEARERQSAQRQAAESREVAALRAEIAELSARLDERDQTIVRLADTIDILIDKTPTWVEKMIEGRVLKSEAAMVGRITEKFAELLGRISAIDPAQARAKNGEAFRFASEKTDDNGDIVELPNPLPPRRAIN